VIGIRGRINAFTRISIVNPSIFLCKEWPGSLNNSRSKGDFLQPICFFKIKIIVLSGTTHKIIKTIVGTSGIRKFIIFQNFFKISKGQGKISVWLMAKSLKLNNVQI
jgi:hypothetical protein